MTLQPPCNPAGEFAAADPWTEAARRQCLEQVSSLPQELRSAVDGLSHPQLDTLYRNWTIRQIVHHIADSHVNSYVRFKWTLTEDCPRIKAYDEQAWSDLSESRTGSVEPSLLLLEGLHVRWCQLMNTLSASDWQRSFVHPETESELTLDAALAYYAWHGRHHTQQIVWLRKNRLFE